jgi:hypothetical protein
MIHLLPRQQEFAPRFLVLNPAAHEDAFIATAEQ